MPPPAPPGGGDLAGFADAGDNVFLCHLLLCRVPSLPWLASIFSRKLNLDRLQPDSAALGVLASEL